MARASGVCIFSESMANSLAFLLLLIFLDLIVSGALCTGYDLECTFLLNGSVVEAASAFNSNKANLVVGQSMASTISLVEFYSRHSWKLILPNICSSSPLLFQYGFERNENEILCHERM